MSEIRPSAEAKNTVMAMVGDASGNSKILTGRGIYGEAVHQVRLNPGERVEIPHTDGTQTTVDASGKVMVGFNGGEARLIELGYPVMMAMQAGYKINMTIGTAVAAGWIASVEAGSYTKG